MILAEMQPENKEEKRKQRIDPEPFRPLAMLPCTHFRSHKTPDNAAVSFVFDHSL